MKRPTSLRILFVCERSGGHVFPAVAMARSLEGRRPCAIYFFATSKALRTYIEKEGFTVVGRSFTARNIVIEGFWRMIECVGILLAIRPRLVIGFGGRDSFFLMVLAALTGRRTAIYEPNVIMGKANRLLAHCTRTLLCGFEGTATRKSFTVGVPLRPTVRKVPPEEARRHLGLADELTVLCFGGSQGSSFLNSVFTRALEHCRRRVQVIHLTGAKEYFQISQFYTTMNMQALVKDFHYHMEYLYSASDIVVSRAGASTMAEISFYGLPSVLIPHPAGGSHQKANALYFKERGRRLCMCRQSVRRRNLPNRSMN